MRILLFAGKGGVGKSTLAAATACASAGAGHRTLVLSTDAAHFLTDALEVTATEEPSEVVPNLWVQHVDGQERFERSWADIQGYPACTTASCRSGSAIPRPRRGCERGAATGRDRFARRRRPPSASVCCRGGRVGTGARQTTASPDWRRRRQHRPRTSTTAWRPAPPSAWSARTAARVTRFVS